MSELKGEIDKTDTNVLLEVSGDGTRETGVGDATGSANIKPSQGHANLVKDVNEQQIKNSLLQRRLAEYYKKRLLDNALKPVEVTAELEEKYQQKLSAYDDFKQKEENETREELATISAPTQAVSPEHIVLITIKSKLKVATNHYKDKLNHAKKSFEDLQAYERTTGTGLIYSKKGKPISDKTVERLLTLQKCKNDESSALCLRYIRARNAVAELEAVVHKLEMLGPGLYVAHYEQLNFEHQAYKNKIEEREDELIKNRGKCTEHNQILAHIREKMHHTDEVIDITECDLGDAEIEFLRAREELGQTKSRRDKLRWGLEAERLKAGLLTRKDLLHDFQDATDEVIELKEKKDKLEKRINDKARELRDARRRMQSHRDTDDNIQKSDEEFQIII